MRHRTWTAVLALALAASCRDPIDPIPGPSEAARALESAMARWAAAAPAAYEVTVKPDCFCDIGSLRPVVMRVRDGSVESRRYADDGAEVPAERVGSYPTVARLFAFIADADAQHAAWINATYDATFGYPVSVYVDYDQAIADDETGFSMTDFHAIP